MSYPQPNADSYAVNGYQYFRLNTLLSSPGDIYESAQGGLALALGPDSDISKVDVAYFDDQVPNFMNQTSLGPSRSFVGRVDARNEVNYMPIGRPGRILFWSDDLYDPNFRPAGFSELQNRIIIIQPRLDVIEFFKEEPSLLPERNDKTYQFQDVPTGLAGKAGYILIPYWGRRYAFVEMTNKQVSSTSFGIFGVNFALNPPFHQVTTIRATASVATGVQVIRKITSLADGMFDMLMLEFHADGGAFDPVSGPVKVMVSDTAQD
jgi:hypothetical protein